MNFKTKTMFLFIVFVLLIISSLSAREWSDEVRMTYAHQNLICGSEFSIKADSRGNIHTFYTCRNLYNHEDLENQAVYQKFNLRGEALSDSIIICEIAELPDTQRTHAWDICIDEDDNVYLLWGRYGIYYTKLDNESNVIEESKCFEGIQLNNLHEPSSPRLFIDSNGQFIVSGYLSYPEYCVFYSRYDNEGQIIDSARISIENAGAIGELYTEIDSSNNLLFCWQENIEWHNYVYYSKISSDDQFIYDCYKLPQINGVDLRISGFTVSNDGFPTIITSSSELMYVEQFNDEMKLLFQTFASECRSMNGNMIVDKNNNIHIIQPIQADTLNDGRTFLGYLACNSEGEIIEPVQIIHDARHGATWGDEEICVTGNGDAVVSWLDGRFDYGPDRIGYEIYGRFSVNDNGILNDKNLNYPVSIFIAPNYPNPFNSTTVIPFNIKTPGIYNANILDYSGRKVFSRELSILIPGFQVLKWQGSDQDGNILPSGQYIVNISSSHTGVSKYIMLMK